MSARTSEQDKVVVPGNGTQPDMKIGDLIIIDLKSEEQD